MGLGAASPLAAIVGGLCLISLIFVPETHDNAFTAVG
jgi:hypothetical protein